MDITSLNVSISSSSSKLKEVVIITCNFSSVTDQNNCSGFQFRFLFFFFFLIFLFPTGNYVVKCSDNIYTKLYFLWFVSVQGLEKYSTTNIVPRTSDLTVSQTTKEVRTKQFISEIGNCVSFFIKPLLLIHSYSFDQNILT